jgi:hypothetical protein
VARKSGWGGGLLGFALLVAVVVGGHYLAIYIDQQRFPWGYANSGSPPLVGTWVGPFTTRSGKHLAMLIDIELVELGRGRRYTPIIRTRRHAWLEGRVLVCDGPGRVRRLEASGEPADNQASRFHLATSPADTASPPEGLAPSHIYGRFDGSDTLALEASLYLRRDGSAITSTADADTGLQRTPFTLRRGTETTFHALCGEL